MDIRVTLEDEIVISARKKAQAVGLALDQVIATYVCRIADGSESLENELLPDGELVQRTLRQQIYRMGA